jgi:FtsZ-binding cell division protein ZapB
VWRSRGEQHALDQSDALLDSTLESEGAAAGGQLVELHDTVRRLQVKLDDLEGANAELHDEVAKAAAKKDELEHDLAEALEQRSKYEKLYNDVLEDSIKTTARQSTKVSSEQVSLDVARVRAPLR